MVNRARLRRLRQRLKTLSRLSWADKWLLLQAFLLLGVTRAAIDLLSFSRLEPLLGARLTETPSDVAPKQLREARRVGRAVAIVSPFTPWHSNCFPQALTAKILLRRRHISTTLYLGATFAQQPSTLQAHAWLRCGSLYVTGGDGSLRYRTLVSFGA